MQTTIEKLEALFYRLEQRCDMENMARLNPPPVFDENKTAKEIQTNLAICLNYTDDQLTPLGVPLQITQTPVEKDNIIIRGLLLAADIQTLVENKAFAGAVLEKLHLDVKTAVVAVKPFLANQDAILAGTAIVTFFKNGKPALFHQANGDVEFRAYSDAIPYPEAFLK